MCGIAGILQTNGSPILEADRRILARQLGALANRGPDASGEFIRGPIAFGHRRLAIRDPEQGQQPWTTPCGNCVLVYNGELYNDAELRQELDDSFAFQTKCDTEVVMAAYLKWGKDCVKRFRGMFAIALYDFRHSHLWLARDRFGVKPLYYATLNDQFVFASSPAAILLHPSYTKKPDWSVVSHYLTTTRLTLGSQSLYDGIKLLQPAEEMIIKGPQIAKKRYWQYTTSTSSMPYTDALDLLQTELTASVRRRLISDVPVGMFLSGGVDSCCIASTLHRIEQRGRYAACATTTDCESPESEDELVHAKECAKEFSIDLESVSVNDEHYLDRWRELVQAFRLPLSTPSDVMIFELAKAAKRHVGVVLGGEGSDELLCGYEIASWAGYDYDATRAKCHGNDLLRASIHRQYGRCDFSDETDHYFAVNSLVPQWAKATILRPAPLEATENDSAMHAHYQSIFDSCEGQSTVEKHAILLHRINLEALLSRLDTTTMHAGLEARVPFTDHELVEKMLQLPLRYRLDAKHDLNSPNLSSAELAVTGRIRSKRILRDVAKRLLPKRLASRRKASFPTGVHRWIANEWKQFMSNYLAQSPFAQHLFTSSFLSELVATPEKAGMWLWPITNLAFWGDAEFFETSYIHQSRLRDRKTSAV